jgi:hypothetical protein
MRPDALTVTPLGDRIIPVKIWLAPKLEPETPKGKGEITKKTPTEYRNWILEDSPNIVLRTAIIGIKWKYVHLLHYRCEHLDPTKSISGCPGECYMVTYSEENELHDEIENCESMTVVPDVWQESRCVGRKLADMIKELGADEVGEKLQGITEVYYIGPDDKVTPGGW